MDYLESLNPSQKEGVINTDGPTMIIAGAGSGKTRVLTYRVAYLMHKKNVDPFNIMSLTFTNKAAREMRERIEGVVGHEARNLWMGTFHSVFARILRSEAHHIGYPSNFTIYDTDDSKSLIKAIVKEFELDDKLYKPNTVYGRISSAKNRLVTWQEYTNNPVFQSDDIENRRPEMGRIYRTYCERCFKAGAMDFDDLLLNTNVLFRDHLDVLHKYQHRFHYVMVDEFQDTNLSQYLITRKLAAVKQNICVVGDDAQSIYAFRGANIQNILNFEKDFPDTAVIKLEQNYRSTKVIVNAANGVIAKNKQQLKKEVWTKNQEGEKIELIKANSDSEEGRQVALSIFEEKSQKNLHYSDFVVLYRTNSQSRSFEEALRKKNIPYRIVGGLSFYQRKEIKDILAYLRFMVNPSDEQAMKRIINLPKRGIGPGTVDKIMVAAFDHDISPWEVLVNIDQFLPGRVANAVNDFTTLIKALKITMDQSDAYTVTKAAAQKSGIMKELYDDKSVEGLNRYENVQELLNAVKEFVDDPEVEDKSLAAFLQEVSLLTDADTQDDPHGDKVTMMTIHMAKGLEFKQVFVVGLEEDLFPSQMMLNSREDLEEERRLFYVAITRAKEKLHMTYALNRYRFGRLNICEPSRFLNEVDTQYINVSRKYSSDFHEERDRYDQRVNFNNLIQKKKLKKVPARPVSNPNFVASDTTGLTEGMTVEHPKFGYGTVTHMDTDGANRKAKVKFNDFGEKTLLLSFAKLRIVTD
jgi:DNA helicase-2/ATP-dependent DNA helicase PcrA